MMSNGFRKRIEMATKTTSQHLTRERVLAGAMQLADDAGMDSFTIRKLAAALGVKPMTIYYHLPSKEAIIDGMVDEVFKEIDLPQEDVDWRLAIRDRYLSARRVLNRHPWAPPLMESRTTPGAATLQHHNAVLGCFRRGLSIEMTAHAYAILDSYLYGFALEEAMLPGGGTGDELSGLAEGMLQVYSEQYPFLFELATERVLAESYQFGDSFEFGLDMIIDGLSRAALTGPNPA
jgi:AcrR family transcriptional regulator